MDRREFLKAAGATAIWLSLAGCGGETAPAGRRPNIVMFMADDLGYETLGAYGGTSYSTPVLDGLAAGGLRFDHCYSTPLCTPTRVQLLTGIYSHRNYKAFGILPPGQTTFAHLLRETGYATCIVGKWQLFGSDRDEPEVQGTGTRPGEAGFDEHCVWQVEQTGSRYREPLVVRNGTAGEVSGGYGPDVFVDYGIDFMRRHRGGPFLLYYPMVLPHEPFQPTPASDERPSSDPDASDPAFFPDHISYMDSIVGRVVSALDDLGLREDTLILFVGDNGSPPEITSMVSGVAVTGGKRTATDAGTHVPLLANWPDTIRAGATDDLVDFADFLPTMVELAGTALPAGADGRSLAPRLRGQAYTPRSWVFMWYDPPQRDPMWFARDHRWKLYGDGNLYDVPADALEANPVPPGASPEADEARTRLQAVLDSLL